jgi:hypothetical protein
MAAFDPATLDRWRALAIVDRDGTTVGTISEFYLDRETGYPTWALVNTGLFGATQTFVPLVHATEIGDGLQVPYEKSHIKDTPRVDLHDELSPDEEATLFSHYGVEYEPSPEDPEATAVEGPGPVPVDPGVAEASVDGPETTAVEGPGPVPADPGLASGAQPGPAETPGVVPAEPGSAEVAGPGPAEAGSAEASGQVPAEPRSTGEPASVVAAEPESVEAPGPIPAEPQSAGVPGPGSAELGPPPSAGAVDGRSGPVPPEPTGTVAADPGTDEATGVQDGSHPDAADGAVPHEPGTADPDEATRVDQQGLRAQGLEPEGSGPAPQWRDGGAQDDSDLSRTAPVEPGLTGSTAADPYDPAPTTIDKGARPSELPAEEPIGSPGEAAWSPGPAGSFEEQVPLDRPTGSSDRWREAKQAAERERIARAAAAPPEERSPLERARRRLERLVGVGQEHTDPEDDSRTDWDAAERARRARLGLDEDDDRRR